MTEIEVLRSRLEAATPDFERLADNLTRRATSPARSIPPPLELRTPLALQPIYQPLSTEQAQALCILAGHTVLHRFRTGYGTSYSHPNIISERTMTELARRGFASISNARIAQRAIGRAQITETGIDRIIAGHRKARQ